MDQGVLDALLLEWWTGRRGDKESKRVAWRVVQVGGMAGRSYRPQVETLQALLAQAGGPAMYRTAVALVAGADGATELRIEWQECELEDGAPRLVDGQPQLRPTVVQRWRPTEAGRVLDLDEVHERGSTRRVTEQNDGDRQGEIARARALDPAVATEDDIRSAFSVLKRRRAELLEMAESIDLKKQAGEKVTGEALVRNALQAIDMKFIAVRTRIAAINKARVAARVNEDKPE